MAVEAEVARERATLQAWANVRPEPLVGLPAEGWRRVCARLRSLGDPEADKWAAKIEYQCGLKG